jgi:hypothetical protein
MASAAAAARVAQALSTQGVQGLIIKGAATSVVLGESVAARPAADVDVLVAPESVAVADIALRGLGCSPAYPQRVRSWALERSLGIERTYVGPGPSIDLHWEVDDTAPWATSRFATMWSHRQAITIGQTMSVWTLSRVDSFLVCAIHGTRERWVQSKGIVDAGRLWCRLDPAERQETVCRARELNCRVAAATTVEMVNALAWQRRPEPNHVGRLARRRLARLGQRPTMTAGDAIDRRLSRWRTSDTFSTALSGAVAAAGRTIVGRQRK